MEKRRSERVRCRFDCEITRRSERAAGTVVDISEGGLSVQTQFEAEQGDSLAIRIRHPRSALELQTIVWHVRTARQRKTGEVCHFLGLVLSKAPDAYFELLPKVSRDAPAELAPEVEATELPPEEDASAQDAFRVRLKARSGPRTRQVTLDAPSLAEAGSLALAELGDEWEILEVQKR